MNAPHIVSVNERAAKLVARMIADASELRIGIDRGDLGETLIDSGSRSVGSIAAGLRIAEICTGGLAHIGLVPSALAPRWSWAITVRSSQPVIACLASQYAGWRLSLKEGNDSFFALGSGPARALARREPLFRDIAYADSASNAILVLESGRPPPERIVAEVAQHCRVKPEDVTIIFAPTQSLAGSTQIASTGNRGRNTPVRSSGSASTASPRRWKNSLRPAPAKASAMRMNGQYSLKKPSLNNSGTVSRKCTNSSTRSTSAA